jgi:hypothetical protein
MPVSRFSNLEGKIALLEDKIDTLTAVVARYGLLSPDVVELKLSVSALTLVVADEAAKSAAIEARQHKPAVPAWRSRQPV